MQNFLHSFNRSVEEVDAENAEMRDALSLMLQGYPEPVEVSQAEDKAFRTMLTREEVEEFFNGIDEQLEFN